MVITGIMVEVFLQGDTLAGIITIITAADSMAVRFTVAACTVRHSVTVAACMVRRSATAAACTVHHSVTVAITVTHDTIHIREFVPTASTLRQLSLHRDITVLPRSTPMELSYRSRVLRCRSTQLRVQLPHRQGLRPEVLTKASCGQAWYFQMEPSSFPLNHCATLSQRHFRQHRGTDRKAERQSW